jgi:hypothetical protein
MHATPTQALDLGLFESVYHVLFVTDARGAPAHRSPEMIRFQTP